uniref:Phage protein n=1 Tax=Rhabditophanes sp. KR3021 TaxID=114890 RepID=A0AC35UIC5_9BILA
MYIDLIELEEGLFQLVVYDVENVNPKAYQSVLISKRLHECPKITNVLHRAPAYLFKQNEELYDLMIEQIETMKPAVYFSNKTIDERDNTYEFKQVQGTY